MDTLRSINIWWTWVKASLLKRSNNEEIRREKENKNEKRERSRQQEEKNNIWEGRYDYYGRTDVPGVYINMLA